MAEPAIQHPVSRQADSAHWAFAGVMHNAQTGQLPLFAWTLGLPATEFRHMASCLFPGWSDFSELPDAWIDTQRALAPRNFFQLVGMLVSYRHKDSDAQESQWAARAIAAACFGCRPLWQEMGMTGEAELATLMHHQFPWLAGRNSLGTGWKPFLFRELGKVVDQPGVRPTGCSGCRDAPRCFG